VRKDIQVHQSSNSSEYHEDNVKGHGLHVKIDLQCDDCEGGDEDYSCDQEEDLSVSLELSCLKVVLNLCGTCDLGVHYLHLPSEVVTRHLPQEGRYEL